MANKSPKKLFNKRTQNPLKKQPLWKKTPLRKNLAKKKHQLQNLEPLPKTKNMQKITKTPLRKKHFAKNANKKTREKTKEDTLKKKPCKTRKLTKTHCKTRKTLQTNTTRPFRKKKKNLAKKTETKLLEKSKPHAKKHAKKKSKQNHMRTN